MLSSQTQTQIPSFSLPCCFQSAYTASAIETFVSGLLVGSCTLLYPLIYTASNKRTTALPL